MGVVEVLVVTFQTAPPSTKPSRRLPQRKVGIEHQPVNDIVGILKELGIVLAERILRNHPDPPSRQKFRLQDTSSGPLRLPR